MHPKVSCRICHAHSLPTCMQPHNLTYLGAFQSVEVFESGEMGQLYISFASNEEEGKEGMALD
jgi:hypothetical protein